MGVTAELKVSFPTRTLLGGEKRWGVRVLADDILDSLPDPAAVVDEAGHFIYRNARWREWMDAHGIAEGSRWEDCFATASRVREAEGERPEILRLGEQIYEHRIISAKPSLAGLVAEQRYTLHLLRDISESWRLAEERHFLERLYRTLSRCNQALVRARDAKSLAQGVCDSLVRLGGYHYSNVSVWLAVGSATTRRLAWAACDRHCYDSALLERVHEFSQNFLDRELAALLSRKEGARRHPVSLPTSRFLSDFPTPPSFECYPLLDGEQGLGALLVMSTPGDLSRVREFGLLEELASDLAFGLEALRLREENTRLASERLAHLKRERDQFAATVAAIAAMVELRDPYTAGHMNRVRLLADELAKLVGLSADRREGLAFAAGIHDIGKIQVPAEILTRPARLTEVEYQLIQAHCEAGAAILTPITFPWPVAEIVRQHHERLDGSGYPRGLRGDEILFEARILAVADVVEAMITHRPYRPAHGLLTALQHLRQNSGTLFDAQVVDACLTLFLEHGYAIEGQGRAHQSLAAAR